MIEWVSSWTGSHRVWQTYSGIFLFYTMLVARMKTTAFYSINVCGDDTMWVHPPIIPISHKSDNSNPSPNPIPLSDICSNNVRANAGFSANVEILNCCECNPQQRIQTWPIQGLLIVHNSYLTCSITYVCHVPCHMAVHNSNATVSTNASAKVVWTTSPGV